MLDRFLPAKKSKCFFCPTEFKERDGWKFEIKTIEGVLVKTVCESCAKDLEALRQQFHGE